MARFLSAGIGSRRAVGRLLVCCSTCYAFFRPTIFPEAIREFYTRKTSVSYSHIYTVARFRWACSSGLLRIWRSVPPFAVCAGVCLFVFLHMISFLPCHHQHRWGGSGGHPRGCFGSEGEVCEIHDLCRHVSGLPLLQLEVLGLGFGVE